MTELKCIHCGESKNLHINYAYDLPNIPIESILCNECGKFTEKEKYPVVTTVPSPR